MTDNLHFSILCRHKRISFFPERTLDDACSSAAVIRDIARGHVEGVERVYAFNPVEHTCDDVTADIAIEIARGLDAGEPVSPELRDFIEAHAPEYAEGLRVFDRSFAA